MAARLFVSCVILIQFLAGKTAENVTDVINEKQAMSGVGNANDFVDEAIVHWRALIKESEYDPLHTNSLNYEMITCQSCKIEGLSTIKRTGDVTLNSTDRFLVIDLNMGFDRVMATCQCEAKWTIFTIEGTISASVIDYSLVARLEQHKNRSRPQLTALKITNEGQLNTYFQGNGFLGTMVQWFGQSFIRNHLRKLIADSSKMRKLLGEAVQSLNISKLMSFS